jgi:hypothetical protein
MRLSAVVNCVALASMLTVAGAAKAAPEAAPARVSGPAIHENLALYFIHGPSKPGPAPLTLQEGLANGSVQVRETSQVNSLEIENLGDKPVFVQSGEIVKGGKQDRTLTVSMLLPPKSGAIPIASFCVEHGRWTSRADESAANFATAPAMVPSHDMKLAMQAPVPAAAAAAPSVETQYRQAQVWTSVDRAQESLSRNTGVNVRAKISASSLQLALENEKLTNERDKYVKALKAKGEADDDIVGMVVAVNGKVESGDVYPSHALFAKMWPKLLAASAIEAVARRNEPAEKAPAGQAVHDFLAQADAGKPSVTMLDLNMRRVLHEAAHGYLIEAALDQGWVHRSYLAK